MSALSITGVPIPTGGAVRLTMTTVSKNSTITLSRAVSGVAGATVLYGPGVPAPVYIDSGDGLPAPLASGALYQWSVTDGTSTAETGYIQPVSALNIEQEPLTALMIRLIQAGVNSLAAPAGITSPIKVLQAMPTQGVPPMPFVVINPDLIQQTHVPIGQDAERYDSNGNWTKSAYAKRVFRVSVTATNAPDREWYRDAVIAIWESLNSSVFAFLGLDIRHRFQAASGQVAQDAHGQSPGFFYADVMLEIEGTMNIAIQPSYGLIETITTTFTTPDGVATTVTVPLG